MEKSNAQRINELERSTAELGLLVRVGCVTMVDHQNRTARVSWDIGGGLRSAPLKILDRGDGWMPTNGQRVVSLHKYDADGAGYIVGAL